MLVLKPGLKFGLAAGRDIVEDRQNGGDGISDIALCHMQAALHTLGELPDSLPHALHRTPVKRSRVPLQDTGRASTS